MRISRSTTGLSVIAALVMTAGSVFTAAAGHAGLATEDAAGTAGAHQSHALGTPFLPLRCGLAERDDFGDSHAFAPEDLPIGEHLLRGAPCVTGLEADAGSADPAPAQLDTDDPGSTAVVVNKQRPLNPVVYAPEDLVAVEGLYLRAEAAASYARFAEAAASDGVAVVAASGYRSYESQTGLYAGYVSQYGQEIADSISARPGHSEHQTGLAVDIAVPDGSCSFQACFEATDAGRWAAENAHRFGFILRYPDGGSETTGYAYEPWHFRYVGPGIAEGMLAEGTATLEEYLRLPAAGDY